MKTTHPSTERQPFAYAYQTPQAAARPSPLARVILPIALSIMALALSGCGALADLDAGALSRFLGNSPELVPPYAEYSSQDLSTSWQPASGETDWHLEVQPPDWYWDPEFDPYDPAWAAPAEDAADTHASASPSSGDFSSQEQQPAQVFDSHVLGSASPSDASSAADICPTDLEAEVVALINVERAKNGLGPLDIDVRLTLSARSHSQDMADHNFLSHSSLDGSSPWDRIARAGYPMLSGGETVGGGFLTPASIVDGWMNSPSHRGILLGPSYQDIGVGYAYNPNTTYHYYWTADFGSAQDGGLAPKPSCGDSAPPPTSTPVSAPTATPVQPTPIPSPTPFPTARPSATPRATSTPTHVPQPTLSATPLPPTPIPPTTIPPTPIPSPTDHPRQEAGAQTYVVSSSSDDAYAYRRYSRWVTDAAGPIIDLSAMNMAGLRFTGIAIPQGARIQSASLQIYVTSRDDPNLYVFSEASPNPSDFSSSGPQARPRSRQFARWKASNIGEGWQSSPDLSAMIQAAVDGQDWRAGNALLLLLRDAGGRLMFHQWDYEHGATAARLIIVFEQGQVVPTSSPPQPTASSPAPPDPTPVPPTQGVQPIPTQSRTCPRPRTQWLTLARSNSLLVQGLLPIWLGEQGGRNSFSITSPDVAVRVLTMRLGSQYNGISQLYAEALTAKLNLAAGARDDAVASLLAEIDALLSQIAYWDWSTANVSTKQATMRWVQILEDFNLGKSTPCSGAAGDIR